eukprot:2972087-Prorocentrum_lima.AAC.1
MLMLCMGSVVNTLADEAIAATPIREHPLEHLQLLEESCEMCQAVVSVFGQVVQQMHYTGNRNGSP